MLVRQDLEKFCKLTQLSVENFLRDCREMKDRSGFIQFNDHTMYVGAPAISYVMLVRLWRQEPEQTARIFKESGSFFDLILTAIKQLPACKEREEMLAFFKVPVSTITLQDLTDGEKGRQLLHLIIADPDTYLPAIHRIIKDNRGRLDRYPYESNSKLGRRDLIWKLRDLAQFEAYFKLVEEIVFWLAMEEPPSPYCNNATYYWAGWFLAYFDFTVYPYSKRLAILKKRIGKRNKKANFLIARAISDPFPEIGTNVPSGRVGGLLSPPELQFIHHAQVLQAAKEIPNLVLELFRIGDSEVRTFLGRRIVEASFRWLQAGAVEEYARIITSEHFPAESRQDLIVKVRYFVTLPRHRQRDLDPQVERNISQHEKLLAQIDISDSRLDILEIAEHGHFGYDESDDIYQKQITIARKCVEDSKYFNLVIELLSNPSKSGGVQLGCLIAPNARIGDIRKVLDFVWDKGFSAFTYALLKAFVEKHPEHKDEILADAKIRETSQTRKAITVYQTLGENTYLQETIRLLNETNVSSDFLGGFWLNIEYPISIEVREITRAVWRRLLSGEESSKELALNITGDITRSKVSDNEFIEFCLDTFRHAYPERGHSKISDWDQLGIWLLSYKAIEVIEIAASKDQSQFSQATTVLVEASGAYPLEVLNALVDKLANPYEPPYLLEGTLVGVLQKIPAKVFECWLKAQNSKVQETLAGHLPKPHLTEGKAQVPTLTRIYWRTISRDSNIFKRAMDNFFAHTLSTGVFWGFGVELFKERIKLGKQLQSDPLGSIRVWSEIFISASEQQLRDAEQREALDDAIRHTNVQS